MARVAVLALVGIALGGALGAAPVELDASSFTSYVQSQQKLGHSVFVDLYAPWCGHCKRLSPLFDELGKEITDPHISLAKMDATVPANVAVSDTYYKLSSYPTLLMFGPAHGAPTLYSGEYERLEPLKAYVQGTLTAKFVEQHGGAEAKLRHTARQSCPREDA
jgi:thiol-disulfide isomerase/thioredoxin